MADLYASIGEVAESVQEKLAEVLEMRGADARQREMLAAYLSNIDFPQSARVLEIGCGTGSVTRTLARWPGVAEAVGIDPSPVFLAKARALGREIPNLHFRQGDGRAVPFAPASFDVVVVHTTLCHVPEPAILLAEAFRVLRPGGWLAIFDGDYATATVAIAGSDPLSACIDAFRAGFVHDPWLVRRLPLLLQSAGFQAGPLRSHGYVEAGNGGYLLTWVDRGTEVLLLAGTIDQDQAEIFRSEARRRVETRQWFGHIAFASILGRKP